ncbi:MAG: formylglycine-generating enzyme family protein, partial [Pseudanabaena sp.]
RDILLGDASISKTLEVLNVLSESICRKLGSPSKSFQALLGELQVSEKSELRDAALPFARVGLDVLRRLGGDHAALARRYDLERTGGTVEQESETEQDFPLQDLEYEVAQFINFPPLQTCEYESATITAILDRFDFETAKIERKKSFFGLRSEWSIQRSRAAAWGFTETLITENDEAINLDMIAIPSGSFTMGAPESEPESTSDERPQHDVTLQSFYLGRYAVTQAQWRVVASYEPVAKELNPDPSRFKGDNRPVEKVSWDDAQEFCQRLSAKTGKDYRLPSEAQWEYACRAGTSTPFHYGETIAPELANYNGTRTYKDSPKGEWRQTTTDVGSFPANAWGLHDMHGNVWEWCEDDWHGDYEDAPNDGSAWLIDSDNRSQVRRLLRGGSWGDDPENCRSACRINDARDLIISFVGFRVCCGPPRTLS